MIKMENLVDAVYKKKDNNAGLFDTLLEIVEKNKLDYDCVAVEVKKNPGFYTKLRKECIQRGKISGRIRRPRKPKD